MMVQKMMKMLHKQNQAQSSEANGWTSSRTDDRRAAPSHTPMLQLYKKCLHKVLKATREMSDAAALVEMQASSLCG